MDTRTKTSIYTLHHEHRAAHEIIEALEDLDVGRLVDARRKVDKTTDMSVTLNGGFDTALGESDIEYVSLAEHAEFFFDGKHTNPRIRLTLDWAAWMFWRLLFDYSGVLAILCDEESQAERETKNSVVRYLKSIGRDVTHF